VRQSVKKSLASALTLALILASPGTFGLQAMASMAAVSAAGRSAGTGGSVAVVGGLVSPAGESASLVGAARLSPLSGAGLPSLASPDAAIGAKTALPVPAAARAEAALRGPAVRAALSPDAVTPAPAVSKAALGTLKKVFSPAGEKTESSPRSKALRSGRLFDGSPENSSDISPIPSLTVSPVAGRSSPMRRSSLSQDRQEALAFITRRNDSRIPAPKEKAARSPVLGSPWVRYGMAAAAAAAGAILLAHTGGAVGAEIPGISALLGMGVGAALMLGNIRGENNPMRIVTRNGALQSGPVEFWTNVGTPTDNPTPDYKEGFLRRHNVSEQASSFGWINGYRLRIIANDIETAERLIRQIAEDAASPSSMVTSISVHPEMLARLEADPIARPTSNILSKLSVGSHREGGTVWVVFAEDVSEGDGLSVLAQYGVRSDAFTDVPGEHAFRVRVNAEEAYRLFGRLAGDDAIARIEAAPSLLTAVGAFIAQRHPLEEADQVRLEELYGNRTPAPQEPAEPAEGIPTPERTGTGSVLNKIIPQSRPVSFGIRDDADRKLRFFVSADAGNDVTAIMARAGIRNVSSSYNAAAPDTQGRIEVLTDSVTGTDAEFDVMVMALSNIPEVLEIQVTASVIERFRVRDGDAEQPAAEESASYRAGISELRAGERAGTVWVYLGDDVDRNALDSRTPESTEYEHVAGAWMLKIQTVNADLAFELASSLIGDERVTELRVDSSVAARLRALPATAARTASEDEAVSETADIPGETRTDPEVLPSPLDKAVVDESVAERKDVHIVFNEELPWAQRRDFIKGFITKNAMWYHWEGDTLIAHGRETASVARMVSAADDDPRVARTKVDERTYKDLRELYKEDAAAFKAGQPENADELPPAPDERRGLLVQFKEGTPRKAIETFAGRYDLTLMEADYRGAKDLVLYELKDEDNAEWFIETLSETVVDEESVLSAKPLREKDARGEEAAAGDASEAVVPRRDPHSEWIAFLNNVVLADGKSNLTPEQAQGIAGLLKPVQAAPGEAKHPTIGRTKTIKKILPVLTSPRGMRNSVMITGEPGVGKTAIAEGLAQLVEDAEYAEAVRVTQADGSTSYLDLKRLRGRWLVELDVDRLLTSDDPVGTLMGLLQLLPMLNDGEPSRGNRLIVLVDEIQKLMMDNAGQKIANALKGHLRDGRVSILATTTNKEYKKYIESDGALARRFKTVVIGEPSVNETLEMMRGAKPYYESQHDADIPDEALETAAKLSHQFDKEHFLPDKAIKLVEDAAELARPENLRAALALDIREGWRQLLSALDEARDALKEKGITSALALPVELFNRIAGLSRKVAELYDEQTAVKDGRGKVTVNLLKRTLAEHTGISAGQLTLGEEDASRYVRMEEEIGKRVINQDRAIEAIANAVRRNKAGLSNPHRPMGKFLFVGPTGTGKTYLVKELARFLFNDPEAYIRFDMSEFMEEHTYMRLVGAPPSYTGYGEGGQLTEAVRKKPYSVILFDEIEKAHPKIWNIFLQVLDDGQLTDSEGRTVDFKNTVIVFTSNVGMAAVQADRFAYHLQRLRDRLGDPADPKARERLMKEIALLEAERTKEGEKASAAFEERIAEAREALETNPDILAYDALAGRLAELEARRDAAVAKAVRAYDARIEEQQAALDDPKNGIDEASVRAQMDQVEKAWDQEIDTAISEGVRQAFRPEFINRLDEDPRSKNKWVTFNRLNEDNIRIIARIQLKEFQALLKDRHDTELVFDEDVIELLVDKGFSPQYGARPMTGAIEKYIVDPLANWILREAEEGGGDVRGGRIRISAEEGGTRFDVVERPADVVEKLSVKGVAQHLTEELLEYLEGLVEQDVLEGLDDSSPQGGEYTLPEPDEGLLRDMMRDLRRRFGGETAEKAAEEAPAQAPRQVFNPDAKLNIPGSAAALGEHNNPRKKDKTLRAASAEIVSQAAETGWPEEVIGILQPESGAVGEGWLKHFIRHAKQMASDAGVEAPVRLIHRVGQGTIRVLIHSGHQLSDKEKRSLEAHLSGTPSKDLRSAQSRADQVNLTSAIVLDHNLMDLYRRVSGIPGARIGYATGVRAEGGSGTDYWLEISRKPEGERTIRKEKKEAPPAETARQQKLTPHQKRELAKAQALMFSVLSSKEQDGPAIRIAAATAWSILATSAEMGKVRRMILEKGWALKSTKSDIISQDWQFVMAASLVMERFGEGRDAKTLEAVALQLPSYGDLYTPAKTAMEHTLAILYSRAVEDDPASLAMVRAAALSTNKIVKNAGMEALAMTLAPETMSEQDLAGLEEDWEHYFIWLERHDPAELRRLVAESVPEIEDERKGFPEQWLRLKAHQRRAVLTYLGKHSAGTEKDLKLFLRYFKLKSIDSERSTVYLAAEMLGKIVGRLNLKNGLRAQLEALMEKAAFNSNDGRWGMLHALIHAAGAAGEADALPWIEEILKKPPQSINYYYETPYFEAPIAWAKVVVRTGLIAAFMRPARGSDGDIQPSKISRMLTSHKPMETAAALYAIAMARGHLGGSDTGEEGGPPKGTPPGNIPPVFSPDVGGTPPPPAPTPYGGGFDDPYWDMHPGLGGGRWHPHRRMPPMI